jgi:hypothetical protein
MRHAEIEALLKGFTIDSPPCAARLRVGVDEQQAVFPVTKVERMRAVA